MNHESLVQLVNGLDVFELNSSNFDSFVTRSKRVFGSAGQQLEMYYRHGFNTYHSMPLEHYDKLITGWVRPASKAEDIIANTIEERELFSQGIQPDWNSSKRITFKRLKLSDEDRQIILIIYQGEKIEDYAMFSVRGDRLPMKLAFHGDKGLYVRDEVGNGTPEFPYETLFLRL